MSKSQRRELYIPIYKVDAAQRLVYGVMAAEVEDKVGEILDYEGSKPHFEAWSNEILAASGGKSYGNVRAMHTKVAAGLLNQPIAFDDDEKTMQCCAYIVDDAEWGKVEAGVYTGFSMGGRVVKKWNDNGVARYIMAPFEVSLVDNPCIPGAYFTLVKMDGGEEERPFASLRTQAEETSQVVTNDMVVAKARELAKAANGTDEKFAEFIGPARDELEAVEKAANEASGASGTAEPSATTGDGTSDTGTASPGEKTAESSKAAEGESGTDQPGTDLRDVVSQKWVTPDGQAFDKKADAISHVAKAATPAGRLEAAMARVTGAIEKASGTQATDEGARTHTHTRETGAETSEVKTKSSEVEHSRASTGARAHVCKSMYSVCSLTSILCDLRWLQSDLADEANWEGDSSPIPAKLKGLIAEMVELLKELVDEESGEMLATLKGDEAVSKSMGAARHDFVEKFVGYVREHEVLNKFAEVVEKAGARHSKADQSRVQAMHDTSVELGASCGDTTKHAHGIVEKAAGDRLTYLEQQNAELQSMVEKAISQMESMAKAVETMANTPAVQPPQRLAVVDKAADTAPADRAAEFLKTVDPNTMATAAIRLAQTTGMPLFKK